MTVKVSTAFLVSCLEVVNEYIMQLEINRLFIHRPMHVLIFIYCFFRLFVFTAKTYGWTSWSDWTPCDDECYRTRERYCYHSGNTRSCGGNVNAYGVETDKQKCPSSICPGKDEAN